MVGPPENDDLCQQQICCKNRLINLYDTLNWNYQSSQYCLQLLENRTVVERGLRDWYLPIAN